MAVRNGDRFPGHGCESAPSDAVADIESSLGVNVFEHDRSVDHRFARAPERRLLSTFSIAARETARLATTPTAVAAPIPVSDSSNPGFTVIRKTMPVKMAVLITNDTDKIGSR